MTLNNSFNLKHASGYWSSGAIQVGAKVRPDEGDAQVQPGNETTGIKWKRGSRLNLDMTKAVNSSLQGSELVRVIQPGVKWNQTTIMHSRDTISPSFFQSTFESTFSDFTTEKKNIKNKEIHKGTLKYL